MRQHASAFLSALKLFGGLTVLIATNLAWSSAHAQPRPPARPPAIASVEAVSAAEIRRQAEWRETLARTPAPAKGCFKAQYPAKTWTQTQCLIPPQRPYPPKQGAAPQIVGNGTDYSAQVPGLISGASGWFENIAGVTSENDGGTANMYSLQINSSFFSSPACAGHAGCLGWQQFVYSNAYGLFMQYWLINYGAGCPSGWYTYAPHCYRNSSGAAAVPAIVIGNLGTVKLTGLAGSGAGGVDTATLTVGGTAYSTSDNDTIVSLSQGWNTAEFNIFGDGNGSSADFNAGSTMNVRTSVNTGSINAPNCVTAGYTGETNNLTLVSAPAVITAVAWPSILFTQSNNAGGPPSCATSNGDTHITTFGGLLYDFQSQGDYVLAQRGSDFAVQARQVSGAPTWPNASVNKAVAMKLGTNQIAISNDPEQLVVNGVTKVLANGTSLSLSGGVSIVHLGNVYLVRRTNGDAVWAQLNNGWMNISVSLPRARLPGAAGLLVNARDKSDALMTREGALLAEPLSFETLYRRFGESWRVRPGESLFRKERGVRPANPDRPFHAWDLERNLYERARSTCVAEGVDASLLDACTLDTAVLKDRRAARGLLANPLPRSILRLDRRGEDQDKR